MRAKRKVGAKPAALEQTVSALVTKYLRSTKNVEAKCTQVATNSVFLGSYNSTVFATSGIPVTPYSGFLSIQQGTGQGARTGNQIELRKLRFRGWLLPRQYDGTTNPTPTPQLVRMLIVSDTDNPTTLPLPGADFFQNAGSSVAPLGDILDSMSVVNTDRWDVAYDRVFKVAYATAAGTGTVVAAQSQTNNDFHYAQEIDIDLYPHVAKRVTFDDTTSNPKTKLWTAYFFCCNANGNAGVAAVSPCKVAYILDCEYNDL